MERKRPAPLWGMVLTAVCFLLTVAALLAGSLQVGQKSGKEQATALEEEVRRAVVLHYAIEGRYPSSVSELKARYKLTYNEDRFIVTLDSFASNLLPDIRVLEIGGDSRD